MVAKRIITTLMLNNGVLFRSKEFIPDYRYTLNFIDMWSVDELVLLDISRDMNFDDNEKNIFIQRMREISRNAYIFSAITLLTGILFLRNYSKL